MKKYEVHQTVSSLWVDSLPTHWEFNKLRSIFWQRKEKNNPVKTKEILSLSAKAGVELYSQKAHGGGNKAKDDITKYNIAHKGDLIVNCMNVISGAVGLSKYYGAISPVYYALVTRNENFNRDYYHYVFKIEPFQKSLLPLGRGILMHESSTGKLNTIRMRISMSDFNNVNLPVPPRDEQDQIVRYLDWQVSKINHLIHGYQKQIKLLDERKTTVINEAVTHGVHADVEMQPVEANWVKEIPAHWEFNKVKQHFEIKKRIAGKEGYDVISITQQGLKVKDIASNEGQMAANYSKYQFVYPGDYAMNHMDLLTGFIGLSDFFGVTSPDYRVFSAIDVERTDLKYFLYVFQLGYKRKIFYGLGRGAANKGRWRMPAINFKNYDIPVPPIEEQREIVEYIEQETEKIDLLKKEVEKHIEYLREYRTRLISDVVTGQIDVRDVVIPEYTPDEDTEIDTDDTGEDVEEVVEDAE